MSTQLFEILSGALLYNVIPKSAQMAILTVLTHCQMNENPCSNQEIRVLFEHGFELENA